LQARYGGAGTLRESTQLLELFGCEIAAVHGILQVVLALAK